MSLRDDTADEPQPDLSPEARLALAEQCRRVTLTDRQEQLARAATEIHLVGNDGSAERFDTDQSYRERAAMGYRAEIAVADYYGLTPLIDYRPPRVGDAGHDYRFRLDGDIVTVDVKSTRTVPPALYLTQKRAWHDRYTLPDAYLLVSPRLTTGTDQHLVGWIRCEELMRRGEERTVNDNPVWRLDGRALDAPPDPDRVRPLDPLERGVWTAADRAGVDTTEAEVRACLDHLRDETADSP